MSNDRKPPVGRQFGGEAVVPDLDEDGRDYEQIAFDRMMDGSERARRGCVAFILLPIAAVAVLWII